MATQIVSKNGIFFRVSADRSLTKKKACSLLELSESSNGARRNDAILKILEENKIVIDFEQLGFPEFPKIYGFLSKLSATENAGGFSMRREAAYYKAVGEAIERYALHNPGSKAPLLLSYNLLLKKGKKAISPNSIVLFSEEAYEHKEFDKFNANTKTSWIPGEDMEGDKEVYVPRQLVFSQYRLLAGEPRIDYATSTGTACGIKLESAAEAACLEVIERDALMRMWLLKLEPIKIDISNLHSKEFDTYMEFFRSKGCGVKSYIIPDTFEAYTVLSIAFDDKGPLYAYIGASCKLDFNEALIHSVEELVQSQTLKSIVASYRLLSQKSGAEEKQQYAIETLLDHALLLSNKTFITRHMKFITSSHNSIKATSMANKVRFANVMKNLTKTGFRPIRIDITPKIKSVNLKVVKVVIPGMQPFDVMHNYRHIGPNCRLFKHKKRLNQVPHPFY